MHASGVESAGSVESLQQQLAAAVDMYKSELARRLQLQSQLLTAEATIRRQASALRSAGVHTYKGADFELQ